MNNILKGIYPRVFPGVPEKHYSNFFHLIADIFWFGILNGTSLAFIGVYLTRIGGTAFHQGLLAAVPAVVNMLFAIPFGSWLSGRDVAKEVVTGSIWHRIFYLFWIPIPMLFVHSIQIWVILGITLVMYIPGTILQVGFSDLFAQAVPGEWRGLVAGMRNAALAFTSVVISLVCGRLLTTVAFPLNYQILFGLGFIGAGISSMHLWFIWKNLKHEPKVFQSTKPTGEPFLLKIRRAFLPDIKAIQKEGGSHFFNVIGCLFVFHFFQFLVIPLFPVYIVNDLKLNDQLISIGNGLFFALVFIISTQLAGLSSRFGNKRVIGIGVVLMGLYPGIMGMGHSIPAYFIASAVGGLAWGLAGGVIYNYLLENVPENNRPPYLAFYNLVLYTAILAGSLLGPMVSGWIGITTAMVVIGVCRILSGAAILRWG
jgi:MFS family permease